MTKERPILFSGPMVRAILAGTKAQTRRVVKPQPETQHDGEPYWHVGGYRAWPHRSTVDPLRMGGNILPCPYGEPGDRLWVRETWVRASKLPGQGPVVYLADGERGAWVGDGEGGRLWVHHGWTVGVTKHSRDGRWTGPPNRWTPSIFMPRWASRLTLEVTSVRVERLHDITDADATAEGVNGPFDELFTPRFRFEKLWESINGEESWDSNPWVWVVGFKRVEVPCD